MTRLNHCLKRQFATGVILLTVVIAGRIIKSQTLGNTTPRDQASVLRVAPYSVGDPDKYRTHIVALSGGRVLVNVEDELYLLNAKNEVSWHTPRSELILGLIVDSKGRVFGIGSDMAQFEVDLNTGKILYFGKPRPTSARDYFSQIKPYENGQYLVVESLDEYRKSRAPGATRDFDYDELTCWVGQKLLWEQKIPEDAELVVSGSKILAIQKTADGLIVQEIKVPASTPPNKRLERTRR